MKFLNLILGLVLVVSIVRCGAETVAATAPTKPVAPAVLSAKPGKVIARLGTWCDVKKFEWSLGYGYNNAQLANLLKDAGIELLEAAPHPVTGESVEFDRNVITFCAPIVVK